MGWDEGAVVWDEMDAAFRTRCSFRLAGNDATKTWGAAVQADTHLVSSEVNPRVTVQFSRHG